ncbi:MAG: DUF1684 domain-containing protein [Actinomycetaceae bacterium]|nr:DUF1684 domain-containing protein [Actinomycetaceae bacterium]
MDTNLNAAGRTNADAKKSWNNWRKEVDSALSEPFGWLTLSALTWLTKDPSPIDDFPGTWSFQDGVVHVHFSASEPQIYRVDTGSSPADASPLPQGQRHTFDPRESPTLQVADKQAEIALRNGQVCVRIRNKDSALRAGFTAVPAWPWQAKWVIPVRYFPYPQAVTRDIFTAWRGLTNKMEFCGDVVFRLGDSEVRWAVSGSSIDEGRVIFRDGTSQSQAAPWRTAPVVEVDADSGDPKYVIDFNYAQNFPAHYGPWATCPRPVAENYTEVEITAGQKRPLITQSQWL